jgi:hypothetical protein
VLVPFWTIRQNTSTKHIFDDLIDSLRLSISLEVVAAISPNQLIIPLPDARLHAGVLLQKLSVALLDILDDAVLGLHLTGALLQTET